MGELELFDFSNLLGIPGNVVALIDPVRDLPCSKKQIGHREHKSSDQEKMQDFRGR